MTPAEWGLLFGIVANSAMIVGTLVKLVAWVTRSVTALQEKIKALEYQVNNDVTGRRVVGEMREDIAAIKAQVTDIHHHLEQINTQLHGGRK